MVIYDRARIQELAATDKRLRLLWTEHRSFENRLDELKTRGNLSAAQQIELMDLKKAKLARKDQIFQILKTYDTQ